MNQTQEIVIDSDDNEEKFSDPEECYPEQESAQYDNTEYQIEVVDKIETMELEERLPNQTRTLKKKRSEKASLIEEMMIEENDIQNETYVLKKVKKDKPKEVPQETQEVPQLKNFSEAESKILQSDVPERLQYLYGSRPRKIDSEELEVEAKWIARRLERKKKIQVDYDSDPLVNQVMVVLDLIKNQYFEVMYIHTYKFNELPDLTMDDLWFIQNRDLEWIQLSQKKAKLQKLNEEKIKQESLQGYIENMINNTFDDYTLENIASYIHFQELKTSPENSNFPIPNIVGFDLKELYTNTDLKEALVECLSEIFLTPEDFAFNLKNNDLIKVPKTIFQRPAHYFQIKKDMCQVEDNKFTYNMLNFYQTLTFLMAYELFFHPLVKAFARRIYLEKVKISTRPKPRDAQENSQKIDITKPDYCVKRIKNRPFTQFKADETGIYLLKNAAEGQIDLCFHTSDEILNIFDFNALSPDRDGMLKHLVAQFTSQENEDEYAAEWNLIRKECINFLVHHLLYPHLQKELEKDILETSEKAVIANCAEKLKYIINNGPCLSLQDDRNYATVMSIVLTENKEVIAVAVDKDGYYMDSTVKLNHEPFKMLNSQQTISNIDSAKKEEYHLLRQFILNNKPEIIVIGDYRISRRVVRKIVRDCEDYPLAEELSRNIIYCSTEMPRLLLEAPPNWLWNQAEMIELTQDQRIALNLGRMQQDSLSEVTKLWSENVDENQILKAYFNELQAYINRQKLMQRYREILIETVNKNGVDLNYILQHKHRAAPLQFISGLGPVKAHYFLAMTVEKGHKVIKQRSSLFRYEKSCFQEKIFWNSSGFIKILPPAGEPYSYDEYKPLDQTRIHPSWHGLARKIEKDVFEDVATDLNSVLEKACHYPDLLKEVDLDDFASHLEQSKGMKNMKPVLEFIINELIEPFKRHRRPFAEWNAEHLFFKMTGLSPFRCQIGSLVQGIILKATPTFLNVKIDSGIESTIYKHEIFEKDNTVDLTKEFYEGQPIVARITNMSYENFKTDFSSLVKITLSLKPSILNNHKDSLLPVHSNLDEYNLIEPNNDYPVLISNKRKKGHFTDRMIMHNKFKNISPDEAIDLLEEREIGEFLFRPGKKSDSIYITWKFYDHIYTHVEIQEGVRRSNEPISKTLTINKKMFSSLNEIIAHYIQPCNKFVKTVTQHPKFFRGSVDTIYQQLQMEKEAEPKYVPYHVLFSKDAPQYVLLCYLKNSGLTTEHIKIDGNGYSFHDALFVVFDELIRYFKQNLNKPDYISYIQNSKKPFVEVIIDEDDDDLPSRTINSGFGIETIKWRDMQKVTFEEIDKMPDQDSIKIKQEKRPPMLCENCGVRGHQANQCPVLLTANRRPPRGGRDSGNKRDNWGGDDSGRKDYSNQRTSNSWGDSGDNWGQGTQDVQDSWGGQAGGDSWGTSAQDNSNKTPNKPSWGSDKKDSWGGGSPSWGGADKGSQEKTSAWGEAKSSAWGASKDDDKGTGAWGTGGSNAWGSGEKSSAWGASGGDKPSWKKDGGENSGSGRKPFTCFNCGEEGHGARDCPQPKKERGDREGKPKFACFNCGEEGHGAKDCPQPKKERTDRPPLTCYNCGEEGHGSRNCTKPKKERGDREGKPKFACFNCGEEGHGAKDCPQPKKERTDRPPLTCYNCGEEGHGSRNCTKPKKERTDRPPMKCYNCGEEGHGSRNCTKPKTERGGGGGFRNSGEDNNSGSVSGWGNSGSDAWGGSKNDTAQTSSWGGNTGDNAWGSQSNDTWGGNKNSSPVKDSWGSGGGSTTNDTWGSKPSSSNNGGGWGSTMAVEKSGDTWGTPAPKENKAMEQEKTSSWGDNKSSDTWGAPKNDNAWGSNKATQDSSAAKDSWGSGGGSTANDTWGTKPSSSNSGGGWGSTMAVEKSGDTWGTPAPKENKSMEQEKTSSWGDNKSSDTWGAPKNDTKMVTENDSWGNSSKEPSSAKNDSWGAPSKPASDSWGNPSKPASEANNDSWGAAPAKTSETSSWGASANDTWGEPSKKETKPASNDSWGASTNNNSWGEPAKQDTKPASNNSWGTSSNETWEVPKKKEMPATAASDSWGGSAKSSWGESSTQETKASSNNDSWGTPTNNKPASNNDSWGASTNNNSWGEPAKQDTKATSWGTSSGDTWGSSQKKDTNTSTTASQGDSWGASSSNQEPVRVDWGASKSSAWGDSGTNSGSSNNQESAKPDWGASKSSAWGDSGTSSWGNSGSTDNSSGWSKGGNSSWGKSGGDNSDSRLQRGGDRGGPKTCFKCNQPGHMAKDCPNPQQERPQKPKFACFNCGEEGHASRDCTKPRKERSDRPPRTDRPPITCYNCGEEGHGSRNCTKPKKERTDRPPRAKFACFKCGEEGHAARDCTNPNANNGSRPPRRDRNNSRSRSRSREKEGGRRNTWGKDSDSESGWKKSDNSGWGKSSSNDAWGKSSNNDAWGKSSTDNKNDSWGKSTTASSTSKNDSWGASTSNDAWGKSSTNESSSKNDGWGAPKNDSWGEKKDTGSKSDSWGASSNNDSWGKPAAKESSSKNDGWGASSSNDTWGKSSNNESSSKNDSWGKEEKKDTGAKNDSWGASGNNDSWGKPAAKESISKNDSWGAPKNDSWGKEEKKDTGAKSDSWGASNNNDSWGKPAAKESTPKKDEWGASSKDSWGEAKKTETTPSKNDSWGGSNDTWGQNKKDSGSKDNSGDTWGSPKKKEAKKVVEDDGIEEEGQIGTWDNTKAKSESAEKASGWGESSSGW